MPQSSEGHTPHRTTPPHAEGEHAYSIGNFLGQQVEKPIFLASGWHDSLRAAAESSKAKHLLVLLESLVDH